MGKIVSVTPKDDYCLEILIDNGSKVDLDLKNKLHTVRFSMLSDKEYFNTVTTDGVYVRWNNKIEISIGEVFQLAQK